MKPRSELFYFLKPILKQSNTLISGCFFLLFVYNFRHLKKEKKKKRNIYGVSLKLFLTADLISIANVPKTKEMARERETWEIKKEQKNSRRYEGTNTKRGNNTQKKKERHNTPKESPQKLLSEYKIQPRVTDEEQLAVDRDNHRAASTSGTESVGAWPSWRLATNPPRTGNPFSPRAAHPRPSEGAEGVTTIRNGGRGYRE